MVLEPLGDSKPREMLPLEMLTEKLEEIWSPIADPRLLMIETVETSVLLFLSTVELWRSNFSVIPNFALPKYMLSTVINGTFSLPWLADAPFTDTIPMEIATMSMATDTAMTFVNGAGLKGGYKIMWYEFLNQRIPNPLP